jgi:hypothetical protein
MDIELPSGTIKGRRPTASEYENNEKESRIMLRLWKRYPEVETAGELLERLKADYPTARTMAEVEEQTAQKRPRLRKRL